MPYRDLDALGPPLGASLERDGARFRLWSTTPRRCEVELHTRGGAVRTAPMEPLGGGVHEIHVPGVAAGDRYRFLLDGEPVADPYARFLPDGVVGGSALAEVVAPAHRFRHPAPTRPLARHVIYELHVGAFTPEGTYAAAATRLAELAELGVTAIELMPLATFAGARGWGYDGVAPFAPHPAYGRPDALRALIDAAHGLGLAVLLDVVYNHFGPAGNVLARYSPAYFTRDHATGWGEAPDFRRPWMRRLVLDNVRMWLEDYRLDGLRFDAVHAIHDPTDRSILADAAALAHAIAPSAILIAEDERNDPAIVRRVGFDGVWADDFHHAVHVTLTGERDGYYEAYPPGAATIARTIERGWLFEGQPTAPGGLPRGKPADELPSAAFVYCLQNHDQVGNRALGDRLSAAVSPDAYAAATMLLLFLPTTPLLFMGSEWAASTPFPYFTDHDDELGRRVSAGRREEFKRFRAFADPATRARIPDPQDRATFAAGTLRWDERARPPHDRILALHRALLHLRRRDAVLAAGDRAGLAAAADGDLLVVRRTAGGAGRVLLANLGDRPLAVPAAQRPSGPIVLATRDDATVASLPPWSALIAQGHAGTGGRR